MAERKPDDGDRTKLCAKIYRLEARVSELEAALRPLAALQVADMKQLADGTQIAGGSYSHGEVPILTVGDVRRARAALTPKGTP